jgi:hypothetical protein
MADDMAWCPHQNCGRHGITARNSIVAKKKYYAVRRGHKTGIYTEWFGPEGAQVQIKGFPGAQYRGFPTMEEAQAFLQELPPPSQTPLFDDEDHVVVYTDGGAIGNPGPGGYGVVVLPPGGEMRELSGGYRRTTNNRMELMAAIVALESLDDSSPIVLHSDSRYMVDAINKRWVEKSGWQPGQEYGFVDASATADCHSAGDISVGQRTCRTPVERAVRRIGREGNGPVKLGGRHLL